MSTKSKIEWTDATWSPIVGCSRRSPGCENCYAERLTARFGGIRGHKFEGLSRFTPEGPRWTGVVRLAKDALDEPLHWKKPRRIFVCSTSDLFHEKVEDEWIDRIFAVMALAPHHTFLVLSKRPERMEAYFTTVRYGPINRAAQEISDNPTMAVFPTQRDGMVPGGWPLPNVWIGVSAENQKSWDERVGILQRTPAAVRFVSVEPMIENINISSAGRGFNFIPGYSKIDQIIVGGESGPGARPFDIDWARYLQLQCRQSETAYFLKQLGSRPCQSSVHEDFIKLRSKKGNDMSEWPDDLRVREYPKEKTPA